MRRATLIWLGAAGLFAIATWGQTPTPTVDQTQMTPAPIAAAVPPQRRSASPELLASIQSLHDMKAINEDTLKKQQAILEALDQLNKDAEQIKIFSKRG